MKDQICSERKLIKSAIDWWKNKKPCSYSNKEHLNNPTINSANEIEKNLCIAVANYIKSKQ